MPTTQVTPRTCSKCKAKTSGDADFCPGCGFAFVDNLKCRYHKKTEAVGVCVICCLPYCAQCATRVNKKILCHAHEGYEIYEGMARVYGISDEAAAEYMSRCLEQKGLHPYLYVRKTSPIAVGGPDYTLFRASGEYDGHIINEVKVMVPCNEVEQAESVIKQLEAKPKKRRMKTKVSS